MVDVPLTGSLAGSLAHVATGDPDASRVAPPGPFPAICLSGGGARGAYQCGVLAGLAERWPDESPFRIVTGVSAGGINAAALACHRGSFAEAVDHLVTAWRGLTVEQVFHAGHLALGASALRWLWMVATGRRPPGAELRGVLDTGPLAHSLDTVLDVPGIRANVAGGRLWALALSATSYATGETITFVDGVPGLRTWVRSRRRAVLSRIGLEHVMASAALPLLFPAIPIDGHHYGDGSIRDTSPLSPAIHLGADRILAISVHYEPPPTAARETQVLGYPPPAQVLGMLMNGVFLDALESDAERLLRVNRTLASFPEDRRPPRGLRPVHLLMIRPSKDLGKLAGDVGPTLPPALARITRGLGTGRTTTPDLLSYLLFERAYVDRLIELGRDDARAHADAVARLLETPPNRRNHPAT